MRNFLNLSFIVLVSITSLILSACSKDDATKDGDKSNGEKVIVNGETCYVNLNDENLYIPSSFDIKRNYFDFFSSIYYKDDITGTEFRFKVNKEDLSDFVNQNIASYTEIETFMKASSMDIYDTEYTFKNGEIILKEATESKIVIQFKNAVWDTVRRLPSENENGTLSIDGTITFHQEEY